VPYAADTFSEVSYDNNDGQGAHWRSSWQENDAEAGAAAGGLVRIECGSLVLSQEGSKIHRDVDLRHARRAILRFDAHFRGE
jgi:hypothetical protein